MIQGSEAPKLRYSRGSNPRRNLPIQFSRKRGESNFLRAFERAYFASQTTNGIARAEFDFAGHGIADLVWVSWTSAEDQGDATAIGLERRLKNLRLVAFELKLHNWRKALAQAFRYSYFADLSVAVLPETAVRLALEEIASFRRLSVGLWSFDPKTSLISKIFTPRRQQAKSRTARLRAVTSLLKSAKLCQSREKF